MSNETIRAAAHNAMVKVYDKMREFGITTTLMFDVGIPAIVDAVAPLLSAAAPSPTNPAAGAAAGVEQVRREAKQFAVDRADGLKAEGLSRLGIEQAAIDGYLAGYAAKHPPAAEQAEPAKPIVITRVLTGEATSSPASTPIAAEAVAEQDDDSISPGADWVEHVRDVPGPHTDHGKTLFYYGWYARDRHVSPSQPQGEAKP